MIRHVVLLDNDILASDMDPVPLKAFKTPVKESSGDTSDHVREHAKKRRVDNDLLQMHPFLEDYVHKHSQNSAIHRKGGGQRPPSDKPGAAQSSHGPGFLLT